MNTYMERAIDAGLLSRTSWYMRHRNVSNMERRIANKRRFVYPLTGQVGNVVLNDDEIKSKIAALKDRLKQRRQNKNA